MPDDSNYDAPASQKEKQCCKAGRVAANYGITDYLDETLADQWSATDGPGLRTLANQFNKSILETALTESGDTPLEGEADVIYDQLTADRDGSASRVERRLEKKDIDPNSLRDSFISYKTIDRHFKNCIDRERETTDPMSKTDAINRLRALNRRVEKVAEKTLDEVDTHSSIGFEDPAVSASVTVVCSECGERKSFTTAVKDGCACTDAGDEPRESSVTDADRTETHE